MVAVEAFGISFEYRRRTVLDCVDVRANHGEIVSIVGANGVGKTTLLRCIAGLLKPRVGTVSILGRDVAATRNEDLAKLVAFVPQSAATRLPISVFDAVLLGRRPYLGWYPKNRDLEITADAIERLGLGPLALRSVNQLSGGERQKVAVARAITQQTQVLILDEPTTYLDLKHQLAVLDIITSLAAEGVAIIMTVHDLNLATRVSNRIVVLSEGRVMADCHPDDITPEVIARAFDVDCEITSAAGQRVIVPTNPKRTVGELPIPLDGAPRLAERRRILAGTARFQDVG